MNNKIVISDMYRCKNKQSFFALHQIHKKIKEYDPTIDVEFHILWDNKDGRNVDDKKWSDMIDNFGFNLIDYDKQFFIDYVVTAYDLDMDSIALRMDRLPAVYFLLMGHYLRRVKLYDYYLIYDDDILINYDFSDVLDKIVNKIPLLITEPMHQGCDKSLYDNLSGMFGNDFGIMYKQRNPTYDGCNAGFQGIDLRIYDNFLSSTGFISLLNLFNYEKIFDDSGTLLVEPYQRTMFETQQQSFMSLMNITHSKNIPFILDPTEYFVVPTFGYHPDYGDLDGWDFALRSKITHFIGHTINGSKPPEFLDRVDEYLIKNNFLI